MICSACSYIPISEENEDCFEKALDVLKKHYVFYKNAIHQRDLELQQVKQRNDNLNKAIRLLQTNQQPNKRFKSQNSDNSWLRNVSSQEELLTSEHSLTDDELNGANNLNMALNSEQLFDTSSLSQPNNTSRSSTEIVQSPRLNESPKRNKQSNIKRCLKDRNNAGLGRTKSEWHTKERNSPIEKSWALKFLHPSKPQAFEEKIGESNKKTLDKNLSLTLKKKNPSKIKQSIINFNKSNDASLKKSDIGDDIIDASPVVTKKNFKAGRSWSHRSIQNCSNLTDDTATKDVTSNKTIDDIVFDFSPSKKTDSLLSARFSEKGKPKSLKFNNDISSDCTSLPNDISLEVATNKSDSSSVVILTPATQDIIFVEDDTCNVEAEIDTMDLLADNLEKLKEYEIKCIAKQPQKKGLETFKIPSSFANTDNQLKLKHEQITQENGKKSEKEKPSCSKISNIIKIPKPKNPLLSSDENHDSDDDDDFMPKPFVIKQEHERVKMTKNLTIKQRFNIDCEDCEKLIEFLDEKLTDAEIQLHLDKCKQHNDPSFMRQNTPKDFWNPFILTFQADDPRNEIIIDNRFKDKKQ